MAPCHRRVSRETPGIGDEPFGNASHSGHVEMGLGVNRRALGACWGAAWTRGTPRAARRDLQTPKAHLSARSVSQARGWQQKDTCPMRTLGGPARMPYRGVTLPLHHSYTLK